MVLYQFVSSAQGQASNVSIADEPIVGATNADSLQAQQDTFNPWESRRRAWEQSGYTSLRHGVDVPAQDWIPWDELYAASFTPKGAFVCRVGPRNALRNGWDFRRYKDTKEPVDENIKKILTGITREYNLKPVFIKAVQTAHIYGRSLVYRYLVGKSKLRLNGKRTYGLRVTHIEQQYIDYNEATNEIIMYRPMVRWGQWGTKQLMIHPDDAVLFINGVDPVGNGHMGIPALVACYNAITWSENIKEAWAKLITQRGLGLLDVTVMGAKTDADLQPWIKKYDNPSTYSVVFHNERLSFNSTPGVQSGFNFNETMEVYLEDVASASGYPKMRINGVQTGAVTGSETDQDSTAEVYSSIQENYEPYFREVYLMLDQSGKLEDEDWDFEWEFTIKMDKQRVAEIFATNANTLVTVPELVTVGQALEALELPMWEGKRKKFNDMLLKEFMDLHAQEPEIQNPDRPDDEDEDLDLPDKKEAAKRLREGKDALSVRDTNTVLKKIFGSGLSYTDITEATAA